MSAAVDARRFARARRLRQLGYRNYPAYLQSSHWREVKARYRESGLPQACLCGDDGPVDLHHTTYERVGAELLTDLVPLCRRCHVAVHALELRGDMTLDLVGFFSEAQAAIYAPDVDERRAQADIDIAAGVERRREQRQAQADEHQRRRNARVGRRRRGPL